MAAIGLLLGVVLHTLPHAAADLSTTQYRETLDLDQVIPAEVRARIDERKGLRQQGLLRAQTTDFPGMPTSVDLRHRNGPVRSQSSTKMCTIFALNGVMENILGDGTDLSEHDGWDNQSGIQNVDASIRRNAKYGIVEERYWPWQRRPSADYCSGRRLKPDQFQDIGDDIDAAVRHLASGLPVYVGMAVPSSMAACKAVINPYSRARGGHALAIVGYRLDPAALGGGYFLLRNSWGEDCGENEKGYQWYPFGTCERPGHYCHMYTVGAVTEAPAWCTN